MKDRDFSEIEQRNSRNTEPLERTKSVDVSGTHAVSVGMPGFDHHEYKKLAR